MNDMRHVVWMTGALAAVVLPEAAMAGGCDKDTDCKGERVCVDSVCVDPPATAPAPVPAAAATPAAPVADGANLVLVTIESNTPDAVLARIAGNGVAYASGPGGYATATSTAYETVCTVPCGKGIDRNYQYVFQGVSGFGGVSTPFVLPNRPNVVLEVESGSQGTWGLGFVATTLGATGALTGGLFWGMGASLDQDSFVTPGIVTTLVSLPVMIWGIYAMATNGTDVTTDQGESLAQEGTSAPAAPARQVRATPTGLGFVF